MTWRVLKLRMDERPADMRVTANVLNRQLRTADKGWSSSLEVGGGANNSSPKKLNHITNQTRRRRNWTDPLVADEPSGSTKCGEFLK